MNEQLKIEAILFAAENPVSITELIALFQEFEQEITEGEIKELLDRIKEKYKSDDYPFELVRSGGGFQFLSKANYHEWISKFLHQNANKK